MEYLYLCRMRKVGYTSTKLHFLKLYTLSVYVRDSFRISTWSLFSGLCFQVRNSRHSLFFCWRLPNSVALLRVPLSGLGVNCLYSLESLMHRTESSVPWRFGTNTCTVPPLIYIYILQKLLWYYWNFISWLKKVSLNHDTIYLLFSYRA